MNRKKIIWIISLLLLIAVGIGTGVKVHMDNVEKEKQEKYVVKQEKRIAKQVKNTFADVTEVEFDKESISENKDTGFYLVAINIKTDEKTAYIDVNFPINEEFVTNKKKLDSYGSNSDYEPKEGSTDGPVLVKYTDGTKGEI